MADITTTPIITAPRAPETTAPTAPEGSKAFRAGGFIKETGTPGAATELGAQVEGRVDQFQLLRPLDLSIIGGVSGAAGFTQTVLNGGKSVSYNNFVTNPYVGVAAHYYLLDKAGLAASVTAGYRFWEQTGDAGNAVQHSLSLGASAGPFIDFGKTRAQLEGGISGVVPFAIGTPAITTPSVHPEVKLSIAF